MSVLTTCVVRGEAAALIAYQGTRIGSASGAEVYLLKLPGPSLVAVFDPVHRALAVFNNAALVAMGLEEIRENLGANAVGVEHHQV